MSNEIIPFITSVTSELNERIDEIMTLINELTNSMEQYVNSVQEAINDIGIKVHNMLNESVNNKKFISESFSKIVKKIAIKMKDVISKSDQSITPEIRELLESSSKTVQLLEDRISDLQLIQIINGLSIIINALNNEVNIRGSNFSLKKTEKGGIPSPSSMPSEQKPVYYERGAKTKTMEEILEEQRKRKELMLKYR
ncbi:MAG: hypothetical protein ACTSPY_17685 [Candidatus Helarchaeota archaeon]